MIVAQWALILLKEGIRVRQAFLASVAGTARGAKHRNICDIAVVREYVRSGPPTEKILRKELMGGVAFLMMVLVPRRPVEMWRMDVSQEKWAEEGNSVEVPTREETNQGNGQTVLEIRRCSVASCYPLTCYMLLKKQAVARGVLNWESSTHNCLSFHAR
jgi:hypothetical protein